MIKKFLEQNLKMSGIIIKRTLLNIEPSLTIHANKPIILHKTSIGILQEEIVIINFDRFK